MRGCPSSRRSSTLPLTVERNALFWYEPVAQPELFDADRLPVWIMELDDEHAFYGFPTCPI